MVEIELSLDDFRDYHEAKKLGELHLPNGSYKISLNNLYDNLVSWKIEVKLFRLTIWLLSLFLVQRCIIRFYRTANHS